MNHPPVPTPDNHATDCHWSVVPQFHDPDSRAAYKRTVMEHLAVVAGKSAAGARPITQYTVCATYLKESAGAGVPVWGSAEIESEPAENDRLHYLVSFDNRLAGEMIELAFTTARNRFRPLVGDWSIRCHNSAPGAYRAFSCSGSLESHGDQQVLCLDLGSGMTLRPARISAGQAVTSNWALPDLIASGDIGADDRFAILDDGEKLCPDNRLVDIGSWQLPASCGGHLLHGTCVQGPRRNPAFYWLDDARRVLLWSNTSFTFVATA